MSTSSEFRMKPTQNVSAPSSGRNTANSSPTETSSTNPSRYNHSGIMSNASNAANNGRMGAGSPSFEASAGSRLYSKRCRLFFFPFAEQDLS